MRVFDTDLILDKMFGSRGFTNVMVKSTDPGQQPIAVDDPACILGQLSHRVRVLVRSRCRNASWPETGRSAFDSSKSFTSVRIPKSDSQNGSSTAVNAAVIMPLASVGRYR